MGRRLEDSPVISDAQRSEVSADMPPDPSIFPDGMPGEVPAEMPGEVPAGMPGEVPGEVPADVPAEMPREVLGRPYGGSYVSCDNLSFGA